MNSKIPTCKKVCENICTIMRRVSSWHVLMIIVLVALLNSIPLIIGNSQLGRQIQSGMLIQDQEFQETFVSSHPDGRGGMYLTTTDTDSCHLHHLDNPESIDYTVRTISAFRCHILVAQDDSVYLASGTYLGHLAMEDDYRIFLDLEWISASNFSGIFTISDTIKYDEIGFDLFTRSLTIDDISLKDQILTMLVKASSVDLPIKNETYFLWQYDLQNQDSVIFDLGSFISSHIESSIFIRSQLSVRSNVILFQDSSKWVYSIEDLELVIRHYDGADVIKQYQCLVNEQCGVIDMVEQIILATSSHSSRNNLNISFEFNEQITREFDDSYWVSDYLPLSPSIFVFYTGIMLPAPGEEIPLTHSFHYLGIFTDQILIKKVPSNPENYTDFRYHFVIGDGASYYVFVLQNHASPFTLLKINYSNYLGLEQWTANNLLLFLSGILLISVILWWNLSRYSRDTNSELFPQYREDIL